MKRILVTGSEGFIGKALCRRIRANQDEYSLFTLDRIGGGTNHSIIDITSTDLNSELERVNPDILIHLAGNVSVKFSLENPLADFQVNAMGTLAVLLGSLETSCSNFIYLTSGGAIYDSSARLPVNEEGPIRPTSPYGLSKLIGEQYLNLLTRERMNWTSFALSNCYGPVREHNQGVIYSIWRDLSNGIRPTIHGLNVSRDFIYIDDVVDAILLACEKPSNRRLNLSSGKSIALMELLEKIQRILKTNLTPNILPNKPGDILTSCLDNSKLKTLLGWEPKISLDSGLNLSLASNDFGVKSQP
jgi:UDP-glucose 4-epimerase